MRSTSMVLLAVLAFSTFSSAQVLLYDTFADASRAETNLPNESAVWVGYSSSGGGGVTMNTGSLAYTQSSGSQKLWTYFRAEDNPVTLNIGEQLIATIEFTPEGNLYDNSGKSFRFGLFNDPDNNQVLANTNSDSGGTGNPWTNATGYGVNIALSNGATKSAAPSVGKRTDLTQTSLMGSSSAWTMTSGGNAIINSLDVLYTVSLTLNYAAADQMDVTFSISDSSGLLSTYTYTDTSNLYTSYEQLFMRFSKNTETADVIDIHSIKVEHIVPEPATLMLLGLGGLLSLKRKK